ncbi:DoxX family protein [Chitinophaga ginsengisoli]|nr:DoxX family protein [Chitinophaga ginsengisoli]
MMKNLFIRSLSWCYADLASLVLRIGFGILMMPHGFFKLKDFGEIVGEFMNFLGLGSTASLWLVIIAEIFCSVLLVIGLFTRLAIIPLLITSIVIVFVAHHGDIFGEAAGGFYYLLVYTAILLLGAGKYSVDHLIGRRLAS